MKISRPTMISVLKDNTKKLTHMNRKQMWKIIEDKGLVDQALELEKGVKKVQIWNMLKSVWGYICLIEFLALDKVYLHKNNE